MQEVNKARIELDTQLRLNHPFIIKLKFWAAEVESHYFTLVLITPYAGSDLDKQLKTRIRDRCYWSEEELVRLLAQVLSALLYCQTLGVAHRDIKPSNIFITDKGEVQLGDFGEAKETESQAQSLRGTKLYMCPIKQESFRFDSFQPYDPFKSDVYSLGVTFWQLAGLRTEQELADYQARNTIWTSLTELRLRYSDKFYVFLGRMLIENEKNRPNFLTLAKHFWNNWQNFRALFPGDMEREECQSCGQYEASSFCLCTFPLVPLCDLCLGRHTESAEHEVQALCFKNRFQTQEIASRRLKTSKLLKTTIDNLLNARALIQTELKQQEAAFVELERQLNKTKNAIKDLLCNTERSVMSLIAGFQEVLETVQVKSQDYLELLQNIEEPYVHIRYWNEGAVKHPVIGGRLADLQALERQLIVPALAGQQVLIYSHLSQVDTYELQSNCAQDTSLAMLNGSLLAGYGGALKPCMLFTLDLNYRKEERAEGLVGRQGAGLVAVDNVLHIFGGKGERSAETWDLYSRRSEHIPSMKVERYRCNPCEYKRKIYLPGQVIEIYDPNTSTYTHFSSLSFVSRFYSAHIYRNTLFLCTDSQVVATPMTAKCLRSCGALPGQWHWQTPAVQVGGRLYFVQQGIVTFWSFPGCIQYGEES